MVISEEIRLKLNHQFFVIRKQAIEELVSSLKNNLTDLQELQQFVFELIDEQTWQSHQSSLILAQHLASYSDNTFHSKIIETARQYLRDPEHHVREAVAECLGHVARCGGLQVYLIIKDDLLQLISENFDRSNDKLSADPIVYGCGYEYFPDANTLTAISKIQTKRLDADFFNRKLEHHDEVWKCLWSSLKVLERIIWGLQNQFEVEITDQILELLSRSSDHVNRFIRQVTYEIYGAICAASSPASLSIYGTKLAQLFHKGLSDNWGQVRYASLQATQEFMHKISESLRPNYFDILLPPMCLNRYNKAADVRTYALETWKQVCHENGRNLVAQYIVPIVEYFCSQAESDNYSTRESACYCISELSTKVDHNAVEPRVPALLNSLIACFKDQSWTVRNAACIALGDFVSHFPEKFSDLEELYHLWFEHLSDNAPPVREDSAVALGKMMKVFGDNCIQKVVSHLNGNLLRIVDQPSDPKLAGLYHKTAKTMRDNDPSVHTGQVQFSCGSLAPKLEKTTLSSADHGFIRERQPWEYTDGCIHLLKELIRVSPEYFDIYLAQIATVSNIKSFANYPYLQQTIWDSIPDIAQSVGKSTFKSKLYVLIPSMIETLESDNRLAANASGNAISFIYTFIGEKMFEARLQPQQLQTVRTSRFVSVN